MLKHLDPFRIVCTAGTPGYLPVVADSYLIGMGKYELTTKEDSINKKAVAQERRYPRTKARCMQAWEEWFKSLVGRSISCDQGGLRGTQRRRSKETLPPPLSTWLTILGVEGKPRNMLWCLLWRLADDRSVQPLRLHSSCEGQLIFISSLSVSLGRTESHPVAQVGLGLCSRGWH